MRSRGPGCGVRSEVDAAGAGGGDDEASAPDEDPDKGSQPRLDLLEDGGFEVGEGRLQIGGQAFEAFV